jgi:NitT/TauT family transport system substrate-binding protein
MINPVAACRIAAFFIIVALASPGNAQTADHIRVAMVPIDVAGQAYYAVERNFFKQHGLDADVQTFSGGGAIFPAVASGAADIGAGDFVAVAQAHQHGIPFVMIAAAGSYSNKTPSAALLVVKNSPVTVAGALAGKTIAINSLKNLSFVAFASWAEKNGLDIKKVKFLEMPMSAMGPALGAGRVDAASVLEPTLSRVLAEKGSRILARHFDAIAPTFLEGAWFCTADYAKSHPDVIRRFAETMADSARWANANPAAANRVLVRYSKAPATPTEFRTFVPERLQASDIQTLIDAAARYGLLDASFPAAELMVSTSPNGGRPS